jgi:cell division transport system permease protein
VTRLGYFLRRALEALARRPQVAAVAIATIAVALFVTGLAWSGLRGAERLLAGSGGAARVSVYLADGSDLAAARAAAERLAPGRPVEAVTPAVALARLRASLGDDASLLDGVEPGVLPAAVEVAVDGLPLPEVRALAARLAAVPGAQDVDEANAWLDGADRLLRALRLGGLAVLAALALGTAILVANTLRLGVFARRDEIAIMKLVGATDAFVRAPFLVEGAVQGAAGGVLAAGALLAAHAAAAPRLAALVPDAGAVSRAALVPPALLLALVAAGAALGLVASALAVSRHLRT